MSQHVLQVTPLLLSVTPGKPGDPTVALNLLYNPDAIPPTLDGTGIITQDGHEPINVPGIHGIVTKQPLGGHLINFLPSSPIFFWGNFSTDSEWKGEGYYGYITHPAAVFGYIQPIIALFPIALRDGGWAG